MSEPAPTRDDGYNVRDDEAALEAQRLGFLAEARDPKTIRVLGSTGISAGWNCIELGAGAGTVSRWMADQVGTTGTVLSTDIELRFHSEATPNMEVRQHNIMAEELPVAAFDLIHARAVLQHLPERDAVITKLTNALRPGGWLVLEDGNFLSFAEQSVPNAYKPLHDLICTGQTTQWRDPNFGLKLLGHMRTRGFVDLDIVGDAWPMRPGEAGGEWWFLALERAGVRLVEHGLMTKTQVANAIAAVREPGFVMMSPLSLAVSGRKPNGLQSRAEPQGPTTLRK